MLSEASDMEEDGTPVDASRPVAASAAAASAAAEEIGRPPSTASSRALSAVRSVASFKSVGKASAATRALEAKVNRYWLQIVTCILATTKLNITQPILPKERLPDNSQPLTCTGK